MSTMRHRARALARPRRGQALIETAIVLPLLLTLVFGVAEVSMYMFDYLQASNCARDAARQAAVRVAGPYCTASEFVPTVTDDGVAVTAAVDTTHEWLVIGNLIPGLQNPMPLSVEVEMRLEGKKL